MKPKVFPIDYGTVIDHTPPGKAYKVSQILKLEEFDHTVTIGSNLESRKEGRKDIIKIESRELTKEELNKIALVSPNATINIIRNEEVDDKFKVEIPNKLLNTVKCPNPKCITNFQPVNYTFEKVSDKPLKIRCHYCERILEEKELELV